MTETNEPDGQRQSGTEQSGIQQSGTAQPGTTVPAAVDPDANSEPAGDTSAAGPASDTTGAAPAGDTIGAGTPGRANTTEKDPSEWVTGDEPMTGAQRSYLDTLARQAGEQLPADLTKAQASEHIDRLQRQTGRGAPDGTAG